MAAIFYFAILAAIYAAVYYLNHKTPLPKGCERAVCKGCKNWGCESKISIDEDGKEDIK